MLSGAISSEDEEAILKELDELQEQEVFYQIHLFWEVSKFYFITRWRLNFHKFQRITCPSPNKPLMSYRKCQHIFPLVLRNKVIEFYQA